MMIKDYWSMLGAMPLYQTKSMRRLNMYVTLSSWSGPMTAMLQWKLSSTNTVRLISITYMPLRVF